MKQYIVVKDNANIYKVGELYTEKEDGYGYYCFKSDEEISDSGSTITSSYKVLPNSVVEDNDDFELFSELSHTDILPETSIEQIKKENEEVIEEPLIKEVKVILPFPGGKEGDVFKYNPERNTFVKQTPIEEDEYILGLLNDSIDELAVSEVLDNIDYFEDITPKVAKTKEEVMDKIADLAEQRLGYEKIMAGEKISKLEYNTLRKKGQILSKVIDALTWAIGEGKDFDIE